MSSSRRVIRKRAYKQRQNLHAYLAREAMEFALLLAGLMVAHTIVRIPAWVWGALTAMKLVSSGAFYVLFLRRLFFQKARFDDASWIGDVGRTLSSLSPRWYVRIHGEVWTDVSRSGQSLPAALPVVVCAVKDRMLEVERLPKDEGPASEKLPEEATVSIKSS